MSSKTTLDQIRSNRRPRCAHCGIILTRDTDSGWEVFVEPLVTQGICVGCDATMTQNPVKKKHP